MALFPCVVGPHKYAGRQQSAYNAALNGTFAARSKLRLCPEHLDGLGTWLEQHLQLVAVGEKMVVEELDTNAGCFECKAQSAKWQLFSNVYKYGMPQMDYYGQACDEHLPLFQAEARLEL
jgi:hypothetical protein